MTKPKMSLEEALTIRRLYGDTGLTITVIAKRYNVSLDLISRIIQGDYPGVRNLPNISRGQGNK